METTSRTKALLLVKIAATSSGHRLGPWEPIEIGDGRSADTYEAECANYQCLLVVRASADTSLAHNARFAICPSPDMAQVHSFE